MSPRAWLIIGAGAAAGVALYVWRRGGVGPAAESLGRAAADAAAGVVRGGVVGAGQAVGIPATSASECDAAMAAGEWWRASFACPAGTFARGAWRAATAPPVDQAILDANDARAARGTGAGTVPAQEPVSWDERARAGEIFWPSP